MQAYVFSSAALAGPLAYFGSHNGKLYAVDARTGTLAWEFRTEGSKRDPMKVLNPDGSLNRASFAPCSRFQDMYIDFYRFVSVRAIMSSPVVEDGVVYVRAGRELARAALNGHPTLRAARPRRLSAKIPWFQRNAPSCHLRLPLPQWPRHRSQPQDAEQVATRATSA
jgi:hypothetical protein